MKHLLLVFGVLLIAVGVVLSLGTLLSIIDGTSEYSLAADLLGLLFAGVLPLGLGGFFVKKALEKE